LKVVTVNPFHVKRAKEFDDNSPTKNDRKDAWVIARRANDGDFFDPYLPEGVYADLRGLTQTRQQHRVKLNQALNQLQAVLDEFFPEFTTVFANPLGQAAMHVLRTHPFPADVLALPTERLASILKEASNRRVGLKRALQLQEAAKDSIGVSEGLQAARLRLRQCLEEVEFWKARLDETEAAMANALQKTGLAPFLLSVPGVGVVTAASLLGEAGDLSRYDDWRQLRKLAGYNLTENSSGQQQSKTHISKRGRPGLRCLLYQAALSLVAKNSQFKALYQYLKTRDQNRLSGKQALVAVACKLLRVLFTLARERRLYDPAKVLGEFRTNQLGLAA
jgi:transposase